VFSQTEFTGTDLGQLQHETIIFSHEEVNHCSNPSGKSANCSAEALFPRST
jgi:hypothetical protein